MNAKSFYSIVAICLITILFGQCKSNRMKTFTFHSVGWKVAVPAYLNIQDSATIYKALPNVSSQDKMLLQIIDTGGSRLKGNSLVAGIKPMEKGKSWEEVLQYTRFVYVDTYNRDYLPKTKVDTVFSQELIDGKRFDKSYFSYTRPNWAQHILIYSRPVNGYEFHCVVTFADTIKGRQFIDIIKNSRFSRDESAH